MGEPADPNEYMQGVPGFDEGTSAKSTNPTQSTRPANGGNGEFSVVAQLQRDHDSEMAALKAQSDVNAVVTGRKQVAAKFGNYDPIVGQVPVGKTGGATGRK